jgi:hypothetical protein
LAGTRTLGNHSLTRITCSNLAVAEDDFARPYFTVIN